MSTTTHHSTALYLLLQLRRYWFELFLLGLVGYMLMVKNVQIHIELGQPAAVVERSLSAAPTATTTSHMMLIDGLLPGREVPSQPIVITEADRIEARRYRNLAFVLNPSYAHKHGIPEAVVAAKQEYLQQYINTYAPLARQSQQQYGIPASITLAQALLESDAGDSQLARESFNHFGIKCRTKCRGCTCRNYEDDDVYDMFRVFSDPQESYHEHSRLLQGGRYRHLLQYDHQDYARWAIGLKQAGYATDKRYAEKLIRIIERLQLQDFIA